MRRQKAPICDIHFSDAQKPFTLLTIGDDMRTPFICTFPRLKTIFSSIAVALLVALSASAQSQITTGTIQGTVKDANGAVVPGANVEIRNKDTNIPRNLVTNEDGEFKAPLLQPGNYAVSITK